MTRLKTVEQAEVGILLEGIRIRYGYDFRHYSHASLMRRLDHVRKQAQMSRYTEMLDALVHDENFFDRFLRQMSITVTDMFRDPHFYRSLREKVIPVLKTFPYIKIWHAGCATGEEVYSMAILLQEENFLDRALIYATDFNKHSLDMAQNAVYPAERLRAYTANYKAAGGTRDFSGYYSDGYDFIKFRDDLKERITFSYHNLVTDGVFGEMNLIFCRNVMIYFDKDLQGRVLQLFTDSLRHGGFLCLGSRETLKFTDVRDQFDAIDNAHRIYKKQGQAAHV